MKGNKVLCLLLGLVVAMGSQSVAAKTADTNAASNEIHLSQPVIVEKGITYVPAVPVCKAIGVEVNCDFENSYIQFVAEGIVCAECWINSNKATIMEKKVTLKGKPEVKNGRVYIPAQFINEALGTDLKCHNGKIDIDYKKVKNRLDEIKAEEEARQKAEREAFEQKNEKEHPECTHNDRYSAEGYYDASSNKWIYRLWGEEIEMEETLVYDIATQKWSLLADENVPDATELKKYLIPNDINHVIDYKTNTVSEDFVYFYKKDDTKTAQFGLTFSEQQADYYYAAGSFIIDFTTGKIRCIWKPMEDTAMEDGSQYKWTRREVTAGEKLPVMPKLPKDLVVSKLPVIKPVYKQNYHAKLTVDAKSKNIVLAYEMDDQDLVPLKEVQSLVGSVQFNKLSNGDKTLSYKGKSITLTRENCMILYGVNKVMVGTKALADLGIKASVEYIPVSL